MISNQCARRVTIALLTLFLVGYFSSNSSASEQTAQSLIKKAIEKGLHNTYTWKSLLHIEGGKPSIKDPNFILSLDDFSLENELRKTITLFLDDKKLSSKNAVCRFPARFYFLQKELGLPSNFIDTNQCDKFIEYVQKAPIDDIYLVFVSENVSSPSSIMGHSFLKITGHDYKSRYVEHCVSFYTVIDTLNIPYLLLKSTVIGMKGFFSLLPYQQQIKRYLENEDRNVWEYHLNFSKDAKKLIQYHIWELKDLDVKYLFTRYNCASVVFNILSLGSKKLKDKSNRLWITPKDIVKDTIKNGLVVDSKLIPSSKWYIRMLSDNISNSTRNEVEEIFKQKKFDSISKQKQNNKLYLELIKVYTEYLYKNNKLNKEDVRKINEQLIKSSYVNKDYNINLSNYKSPVKTFDDSQLSIGIKKFNKKNYMKINFLPASHTITDDNREYFNESALRIADLSLLLSEKDVELDSLSLISTRSLLPYNKFIGGSSIEFKAGIENHYDTDMNHKKAGTISLGLGLTKKISTDINGYLLFNFGAAHSDFKTYPYVYPEIGATVYELFNMKTYINYKYIFNQLNSNQAYQALSISQSLFIKKHYKASATYEYLHNNSSSASNYEFIFSFFF